MENNETVYIRFLFDSEKARKRLRWKDLKALEKMQNGEQSQEKVQALMARFMVNEQGEWLPQEAAIEILDELTADQVEGVIRQFTEAMQEGALPNANGRRSSLPSEAVSPAPLLSPDGAPS